MNVDAPDVTAGETAPGMVSVMWTANAAMLEMWREIDWNAKTTNGEMMKFFERHLQAAHDAGKRDANDALKTLIEAADATANTVNTSLMDNAIAQARAALLPEPQVVTPDDIAAVRSMD